MFGKSKIKWPSLLSFAKKIVPSDGVMYAVNWDNRLDEAVPLHLTEKTVRGTISNKQKDATKNDPAKLNADIKNANPQTVDACALPMDKDTLKLKFTLKFLGGIMNPCACNEPDFAVAYRHYAESYIEEYGFRELARRYATNIANARFLWRNRLGAEKIEVRVSTQNLESPQSWTFNAYDFILKEFPPNESTIQLSELIASVLCSKESFLLLNIETYASLGEGQEVYPSEEFINNKDESTNNNSKESKKKVLYQLDNVAAMHSQKLGNALRTIDTWYPAFCDKYIKNGGVGPIAVEPYGAVTHLSRAFRPPAEKKDFYYLAEHHITKGSESLSLVDNEYENEEHYIMAVFVRGGVFSEPKNKGKG